VTLPSSPFEVVDVGLHRLTGRLVLPAAVAEVADQFLLLAVHTDHRLPGGYVLFGRGVDVGELGIPVRVAPALDGLGVALQAEVLFPQEACHGRRGHLVTRLGQLVGQVAQALGRPPQRRLRITARFGLHQRQQRRPHPGIGLGHTLAATTDPPRAPQRLITSFQLPHAAGHRNPAHPCRPGHYRDPAMSEHSSLSPHRQPSLTLIKMREQRGELRRQRLFDLHGNRHSTTMTP
jgi:hypothetical protein